MQDVRWLQRLDNFEQAYLRLQESLAVEAPNELERNGIVLRFEFTIELAWKVMKDFLESQGFQFKPSPKNTFRQAQQGQFITNAQVLIDALNVRNELSHDYSGAKFEVAEEELRQRFFPALTTLYHFFRHERDQTHSS